jgi:hypothetical protein
MHRQDTQDAPQDDTQDAPQDDTQDAPGTLESIIAELLPEMGLQDLRMRAMPLATSDVRPCHGRAYARTHLPTPSSHSLVLTSSHSLVLTSSHSLSKTALARLVSALYIPFADLCRTWVLSPRFVHLRASCPVPLPCTSVLCALSTQGVHLSSVNTTLLVTFLRGRRRLGCRRDLACRNDFKAPTAARFLSPLCTHGTEANERYTELLSGGVASVWRRCGKCFRWSCQVLATRRTGACVIDGAWLKERH